MNCSDVAEILDERNVEQLGREERQGIEAHLKSCPECARDWELHVAFSKLTDMRDPTGFPENCRALVAAGSSAGRNHRIRSRLVLIGVFVAVAAAAAMLAAFLQKPVPTPVATLLEPAAVIPPGAEVALAIALPGERGAAPDAPRAEISAPATGSSKFTVRVLPVKISGADEAVIAALNALQAAVIHELRAIPGLTLIYEGSAGNAVDVPVDYEVSVAGGSGTSGKLFTARLLAGQPGADGKLHGMSGTVTGGNASCPGSANFKPAFCDDPASVASDAVNNFRTTLFPFDAAAQRLLLANLLDASRGIEARMASLAVFARRSDTAGSKGVLSDPAVVRGAIELAASNASAAQRAHVWRTMRGVRHPDLIQPLLASARQSAGGEVQQEAVRTLADFADDASVRDALASIARTDSRPLIRALAQRGLEGDQYWNAYVSSSLKDASRTDVERVEAFLYHAVQQGRSADSVVSAKPQALRDVLDDGAIQALAEVLPRVSALKGPIGNRTGLVLINVASIFDHPVISKMVRDNLVAGANVPLWMSVAGAVVSFRGTDPALRATLEKIAAEDANPEARKAAERILQQPDPASRNSMRP